MLTAPVELVDHIPPPAPPAAPRVLSPIGRLQQATARRHVPLSLVIELTRKCNLTCIHCYATPEAGRRELTIDDYRALLDDLRGMGTLFVLLTGGDVTVNPHFLDIARYASDRRLAVQIFTNAVLLDDAQIAALAELNIFHIAVSVYGASAATHDAITRHPGSFERTIRNSVKLHAAGIYTHLKYIMMKGNAHEYDEMKALGDRLGLPYRLDVSITPRHNQDRSVLELRIAEEDLRRIFIDQINCFPGAKPCAEPDAEFGCGMGKTFGAVNAYGDVYPCIQMPVSVGNIRERGFRDIWWKSPRLEFFRTYPNDHELPVCTSCDVRQYCYRCPGIAYQETGDFYAPYADACRQAYAWRDVAEGHRVGPDGACSCGQVHTGRGLMKVGMTEPV